MPLTSCHQQLEMPLYPGSFQISRKSYGKAWVFQDPLALQDFFTPMVISMVAVGEETGNLDEMLSEISKHYDEEVEYAVAKMSANLGPILIVGLAAVVGFFALAIFLPMWDLTKLARM